MLSPVSARLPMARNCAASPDAADRGPRRGPGPSRSRSAFEGGDPLFENGGGRIGQAGIDIAELAQRKAIGTILRIVEHIGCSLVNGYGTGTGNRIGYLSGVDLQRVEAVIFLAHGFID